MKSLVGHTMSVLDETASIGRVIATSSLLTGLLALLALCGVLYQVKRLRPDNQG
jgi:hypothetical protein